VVTVVVVDVTVEVSSVVIGVVTDVVVVGAGQLSPAPGAGHASQQLEHVPAVPPLLSQAAALRAILHFVLPAFSRQQVTAPGLPHVERETHGFTWRRQSRFTRTASI
jgi:hypothetical protein